MGLFDRWKKRERGAWSPPAEGACGCPRHLDEALVDSVVPFAPGAGMPDEEEPMTVGQLIDAEALTAEPVDEDERVLADGTGPYHWNLWVGDEARASYEDDAALQLDAAVAGQPGIERVSWLDREVVYLGAPTLCRNGVLAAAASALLDPAVRDRG